MEKDDVSAPQTSKAKRGRKPLGDAPMTAAERKRQSRATKAAQGSVEFALRLSGDTLTLIDLFATANEITRSEAVSMLVADSLRRLNLAFQGGLTLHERGATNAEIVEHSAAAFGLSASEDDRALFEKLLKEE